MDSVLIAKMKKNEEKKLNPKLKPKYLPAKKNNKNKTKISSGWI